MKIYGDINSGNCLKVKWVCDHLALPYVWVAIDTLKQETRTQEFLKLNDAGQVPVVAFDDGRTLAQSNAIIRYLARGSALIPTDAFAAAKMDEWLFWEQYSHETAIAVLRFHKFYLKKHDEQIDPALPANCAKVLALMNSHLEGRKYFVSAKLSLADIALVAYTRFSHQAGIDLGQYPNVHAWVRRIEDELTIEHAES